MSSAHRGKRRCKARRRDGSKCGMAALTGQALCYTHSPTATLQRAASRRSGGKRTRVANAPAVTTSASVTDVCLLLTQALADARMHENSLQRATVIARLSLALMRAIEAGEIEDRLNLIEQRLAGMERER